jgi:predicted Zn finger-like uncharacterized protein
MNVICPSCSTVYRVDPAKVPERGVRARCRICAAIFQVPAPGDRSGSVTEIPQRTLPIPEPVAVTEPPPAPPVTLPPPAPVPPPPPPAPPAEARPPEPAPRVTAPRTVSPGSARPSIAIPPVVAPPPRSSGSDVGRSPAAVPPMAPPATPRPAAPPAAPAGKRMINPFMSQDPQQKARRLARALISDLVVYYPDRRQEGLRKGNLKDVFGEEIKKSWEEYREQVGKDIAESTSYFNDALNEILAGGQKLW